jgi:F-type H+-transporting ATPase subunit a
MEGSFEHERLWHPLAPIGISHPFWALQADTIINTWVALAILILLIITARLIQKTSLGSYLVRSMVKNFMQLVEQSAGTFIYRYYTFIASLFTFIIICNWVALIPYVEEPTKDLNTTLALGIIAFLYLQKEIIRVHGIWAYLKDYFMPIDIFFPLNLIAGLIMLPIKLLGEVASIISLSFRLFGNIFGGAIIITIFHQLVAKSVILNTLGTFLGINLLLTGFFILFEGFLQAFVFSILTLTNISMATAVEQEEHS